MLCHCTDHVQHPLPRSACSVPLRGAWAWHESTRAGRWHWGTAQSHVQPQYYLPFSTGWGGALGKHQRRGKSPPSTSSASGYGAWTLIDSRWFLRSVWSQAGWSLCFCLQVSYSGLPGNSWWHAVFSCTYPPPFAFLLPWARVMALCMCLKQQTSASRCWSGASQKAERGMKPQRLFGAIYVFSCI